MIISFAWTTEAFLDGSKTVTRRFWSYNYAKKFKAGDIVGAWDKNPRSGGKKIGQLKLIKDPYLQRLEYMTNEHFEREGGTRYWKDKEEFIKMMGGDNQMPWVVEFVKEDSS